MITFQHATWCVRQYGQLTSEIMMCQAIWTTDI